MSSRPRRGSFSSPPPTRPSPGPVQLQPQHNPPNIPVAPRRLSRPSPQHSAAFPSPHQQNGTHVGLDYDPRVYTRVQAWRGDSTAGQGDHPNHYSSSPPDERDSDDSMETIIIPIKDVSNHALASRVRADSSGSQPVGLSRGRPPLASTTSTGLQRRGSAQLASCITFPPQRRASSPGFGLSASGLASPDPGQRGRTSHPLATAGPFAGAQGITPLPTHPSPEHRASLSAAGMGRRAPSPGSAARLGLGLSGARARAQTPAGAAPEVQVGRRTVGFDVPGSGSGVAQGLGSGAAGRSPSPGAGMGRRFSNTMSGLGSPSLSSGWGSPGPRPPTPGQSRPNGLTTPHPGSLSRSSSGATVTPLSESSRQALESYARSFHPSPRDDPHRLYGSLEQDLRNVEGRRREAHVGSSLSPVGRQVGGGGGGLDGGRRTVGGGWS